MICMRYQVYSNGVCDVTQEELPDKNSVTLRNAMLASAKKKDGLTLHDTSLGIAPCSQVPQHQRSHHTIASRLPPVNRVTKLQLVLKRNNIPKTFNSHRPVRMNPPIPHTLPDIHQKHRRILHTPPMTPRQRRHSNSLKSTREILIAPSPQLFVPLILRPRIARPPEPLDLDVYKPNLFHDVY